MSLSALRVRIALYLSLVTSLLLVSFVYWPDSLTSAAQERRTTQLKKTHEWRIARNKRPKKVRTTPPVAAKLEQPVNNETFTEAAALVDPLAQLVSEALAVGAHPPEIERYDKAREAAEYFFQKRLPEDAEQLPLERYVEAQTQMQEMAQFSTATNQYAVSRNALRNSPEQAGLGNWTYLGPGNVGGRTRAIVINPKNPEVMYAGGVSGGVWKSTNGGQSWSPISDLISNLAIGSLALDPANPDTIYAGTGEGYMLGLFGTGRAGSGANAFIRGLGIYKSTDAGATWTRLPGTDNPNFYALHDIVISAKNSMRVYAATETGVWRSLDGGMTWARTLQLPSNITGGCLDLAIRTDQDADVVLAACGTLAQSAVYRTTDAGAENVAWSPVLNDTGMARTVLAIAPSNQNVMYAVTTTFTGNFNDSLHAVFRSSDGGATWTARVRNTSANKMNRLILSAAVFGTLTDCKISTGDQIFGQALYDMAAAVDPADENRLWAGGIEWFRSDDGGANWGIAGFGYTPEGPWQVHPDQHAIVFHPNYNGTTNQTVYIGNDGGIYKADNARADVGTGVTGACQVSNSKLNWVPLNNGYGVTQFYQGAVSPDGKFYMGGTQDNGTVGGTDAEGPNAWRYLLGGDGAYSAIDYYNPKTLYVSSQAGNVYKSDDGGQTFSYAKFGYTQGSFIDPYVMDPSDPSRIYIGVTALFRSPNGMTNWQQVTPTLSSSTPIGSVAIAPTDANFGMIGLKDGTIIRTNRLLTLTPTSALSASNEASARPRSGVVSWLAFDPTNKNIAYATIATFNSASAQGHVYRTIDGGGSWTNIDGSGTGALPDVPAHCIVVDPSNTARLYVGTDVGVFVSTNGGTSWAVENTGFANAITESLEIKIINGETWLYAFTHGRGAWKVMANRSGCLYSVTPATRNFSNAGGDAVINIKAEPTSGCDWRAASNVPWIELAPNAQGSGNGTVALKVQPNTTLAERAGTVTVAGRSFSVVQEPQADIVAPVLTLTGTVPSTTTTGLLNLAGTATDNVRVVSVSYTTDRGFSGTGALATTGNQWAIANVPLLIGRNEIRVTANDPAGNVSQPLLVAINATATSVLATVAGTGTGAFNGDGLPALTSNISNPSGTMFFDGGGNFYFADFNLHRIRKVSPDGIMTTVAGSGVSGNTGDGGSALSARLSLPRGAVADANGNIYVLDSGNNRIRRVNVSSGLISAFAGTGVSGFGGDGGPAAEAQFNFGGLGAIALDAAGNLFIGDSSNNRIRRVDIATGAISTFAGTGTAGFSGDGGPAKDAQLRSPQSLYWGKDGNLYFADNGNFRIRKITADGAMITTVAGTGSSGVAGDGGPATAAALGSVFGIALDSNNNIYLSDVTNNRIRRVGTDGNITLVAGGGTTGFSPDGSPALGARFALARHLGVDAQNTLYIAEANNFRVRKLVNGVANDTAPPTVAITEPASGATFTASNAQLALRGTASDNGGVAIIRWSNDRGGSGQAIGTSGWTVPVIGLANGLNNIAVTAWDVSGNTTTARLAVTFNAQQVLMTIAGTGVASDSLDNIPAATAALSTNVPSMALDRNGNLLIADATNRRIRRITPAGQIQPFAGSGSLGVSGDGGPALNATMNLPRGIAFDGAGNLYFSDANANRLRRVTPDGTMQYVAGSQGAEGGFSGDGGPASAAALSGPSQVAVDGQGNIYIADTNNFRVRKINASDGKISTIVGTGQIEFNGDGLAGTQTNLYAPFGIAADAQGNLYIADLNQRIRRYNAADGKVTTVVGTGTAGFNGDGRQGNETQISLNTLSYLSLDPAGDLIIADSNNHRVRKLTVNTGVVATLAGTGIAGFVGDGGSPLAANLSAPTHAIVDAAGNLYIADRSNFRIRRTYPASALKTIATLSAASYAQPGELTSEMIAAAFGTELTTTTAVASSLPLPLTLAGASVRVRDAVGIERLAPLFFVSPGQINYLVPSGTAIGAATVTVTNARGEQYVQTLNVANVAPGLFAANANGQGVAAAVALRINAKGVQSYEDVVRFDSATSRYVPVPIDLGPEGDQVFLILFGTGVRNRNSLATTSATVGGSAADVLFAGPQGALGLDQINVRLARTLIGRGDVEVTFTADGRASNAVRVTIR